MRRDPWIPIGLVAFFALLFVALFGERIAPHETIYFVLEHGSDPRPYDPGLVFPFGSDVLGRDLISLVLAGARMTLVVVTLGGLARVAAAIAIAMASMTSRVARLVADWCAELVSAVPATLVLLVTVLVFVRGDAPFGIFVAGLLVTGWAGPYRVLRAELDRLARAPFTEGAMTIGARRVPVLVRHHLPHLVPLVAVNASQQTVASLVALAELGVLAVFVGTTRFVNVLESLTFIQTGVANQAIIADPPEWGGLLANARTILSLWTTRWLFVVPGLALGVTAVAVAAIGHAIARAYARRNVLYDLRGRGIAVLASAVLALVTVAAIVPERYAAAREWADDARVASSTAPVDVEAGFRAAGLQPVADRFALERDVSRIVRSGPASIRIGERTAVESQGSVDLRSFVDADTGGGRVEAPLVYLGHGVSPSDYPPRVTSVFSAPDLGTVLADFADAYANVDVRGKIVVIVRYRFVEGRTRDALAPDIESVILNAKKHSPAAIIFVDQLLPRYVNVAASAATAVNPYNRLETNQPVIALGGTPVVIVSAKAADELLAQFGIRPSAEPDILSIGSEEGRRGVSRELPQRAVVDVPLVQASAHVRSVAGELKGAAERPPLVIWAVHRDDAAHPVEPLVTALARELSTRGTDAIFVLFDAAVDPVGNSRLVADALGSRKLGLFLVLDALDGEALRFTTPFGELGPALDRYAENAGARYVVTRTTASINDWSWPGSAPYIESRAVVISGTKGAGDVRADAAALVAYIAGRRQLGAEELKR